MIKYKEINIKVNHFSLNIRYNLFKYEKVKITQKMEKETICYKLKY